MSLRKYLYVYNTAKYNNDVIKCGEWVLTGINMHTALTDIDFRLFVHKELTLPSILTKLCGVLKVIVDRWHHLILLSLEVLLEPSSLFNW